MTTDTVKLRAREDRERERVAMQDRICRLMVMGMSLSKICKLKGMPALNTVIVWRRKYPDFLAQYKLAKQDRGDTLRDRAIDVAEKATEANVNSSRLKVDTLKWAASHDNGEYHDKLKLVVPPPLSPTPADELNIIESARRVSFHLALGEDLERKRSELREPLLLEHEPEPPAPVCRGLDRRPAPAPEGAPINPIQALRSHSEDLERVREETMHITPGERGGQGRSGTLGVVRAGRRPLTGGGEE
mgnify:CR=1 FL=1